MSGVAHRDLDAQLPKQCSRYHSTVRNQFARLIRDIIGIALLAVAFMGCTPLATGPKWIRQDRRFKVSTSIRRRFLASISTVRRPRLFVDSCFQARLITSDASSIVQFDRGLLN
jgi:hypothetical protein